MQQQRTTTMEQEAGRAQQSGLISFFIDMGFWEKSRE